MNSDKTSSLVLCTNRHHYQTNCVTEVLPQAALERAKYLDSYLATNKKPIGPLHGLPISVKEHIGIKGLGLNCGFVGWWDRVAPEDAYILQLLQNAGCVLYVRTTQPQCLMVRKYLPLDFVWSWPEIKVPVLLTKLYIWMN